MAEGVKEEKYTRNEIYLVWEKFLNFLGLLALERWNKDLFFITQTDEFQVGSKSLLILHPQERDQSLWNCIL